MRPYPMTPPPYGNGGYKLINEKNLNMQITQHSLLRQGIHIQQHHQLFLFEGLSWLQVLVEFHDARTHLKWLLALSSKLHYCCITLRSW